MRFMVLVKATKESEAGQLPTAEQLQKMGDFNEELVKAGVLLAGEGLQASSKGARLSFDAAGKPTVIEGPFAETTELVSGFWIIQTKSRAEAVEWMRRAPMGPHANLELRQIFEAADFGAAMSPEEQAREARLAEQARQNARS